MERRTLLAIVLCVLVFVVYSNVVMPLLYPPQPTTRSNDVSRKSPQAAEQPKEQPPKKAEPLVDPKTALTKVDKVVEKTLGNKKITVTLTNKGASVKSVVLNEKYMSAEGDGKPYEILRQHDHGHLALSVAEGAFDISTANWEVKEESPSKIVYGYAFPSGLEVKKVFTIDEDSYTLCLAVLLENRGAQDISALQLDLVTIDTLEHDSAYRADNYLSAVAGLKTENWKLDYHPYSSLTAEPKTVDATAESWQGLKNRYFAALVIPQEGSVVKSYRFTHVAATDKADPKAIGNISCGASTQPFPLAKGASRELRFVLYTGPIVQEELDQLKNGVGLLYDFTGFDFIASIILSVLGFFQMVSGNYGIAIIFTTLLLHVVLFPLIKKGQVSMFKMQQLKPKLDVLKEKYKGDSQKAAVEQMRLFKENGVSPMSGCLPMILQLPVFIGMYAVVENAIEFRQSGFLFWITDLSQPERLAKLPFTFLGISDFNLLPIVMTITWVAQSLLAPKSPDPQAAMQQKLMTVMPVVFGFLFYNMASGLSLYFFVNSLIGIIEQKIIRKFYFR